ncbi:MAG: cbb3-type cytochrome oxidase assembly protein CcoS [Aliishimia sp.]
MSILVILIPVSLGLGVLALLGFLWTLKADQYSDMTGDAMRILNEHEDAPPQNSKS